MLKLYLYGYLNRVRSSRRLEAEATRNLELIWLLRGLRPDFKTIADFRRDNRGAFKAVFRAFVVLCRKFDLFGRELLAVDGTRLKAVNNPGRNSSSDKLTRYMAVADERIERYLAELDAVDRGEDGHGPGRRETLAAKIAKVREQRQVQAAMLEQLTQRREPDLAGRPRCARDGDGSKDHSRLQRAGGGRCEAQAHRRAARHQRRDRHGSARIHRRRGQGGARRRAHRCRGGHGLLQG